MVPHLDIVWDILSGPKFLNTNALPNMYIVVLQRALCNELVYKLDVEHGGVSRIGLDVNVSFFPF